MVVTLGVKIAMQMPMLQRGAKVLTTRNQCANYASPPRQCNAGRPCAENPFCVVE